MFENLDDRRASIEAQMENVKEIIGDMDKYRRKVRDILEALRLSDLR